MNYCQKYLSVCLLGIAALVGGASPAFAADAPSLGAASDFAVLSVGTSTATPPLSPDATAAVTTTRANITGNVGSAGAVSFGDAVTPSVITGDVVLSGAYTQVPAAPNAFSGSLITPLPVGVITDFNAAYDALEAVSQCTETFAVTSLGNHTFTPGVYCFDAAVTESSAVWTLNGGSNSTWLFKIGTLDPGALTGNTFSVVLAGGASSACNVTWWVDAAATMTDSDFKGTILAGAAIDTTRGTFDGRALAKAAVTITDTSLTGCEGSSRGGKSQSKCNQGVGNGPENCDPGNSNQDGHSSNPFDGSLRTNDELGGTPGDPGRLGN